jgi:hypothetical protein
MFRLTIAGPDSHIASPLCAACPHAAAGCCVAPPRYAWADIARVVHHGGRDWLLREIAAGSLVPFAEGLSLRRVKMRLTAERGAPRVAKCVFHEGGRGCTIAATQRPATCNYYVCEDVYREGERAGASAEVQTARAVHDDLVRRFIDWDEALTTYVRTSYPDGPPYDAPFFDDLAAVFASLQHAAPGETPPT